MHCIVGTGRRTKDIVWTSTHKETWDIEESWSYPGKIADALKVVEGWDKRVIDITKKTPEHHLVDYKLSRREPLPGWTSKRGRMILLGDSAHPFLVSVSCSLQIETTLSLKHKFCCHFHGKSSLISIANADLYLL